MKQQQPRDLVNAFCFYAWVYVRLGRSLFKVVVRSLCRTSTWL